jgi:hypothetical protein
MFDRLTDYYFWFPQPPTILSQPDMFFGYIFAGIFILAIVVRIVARFMSHDIYRKALLKFWYLGLTVGLSGLIWFGMRYENTQIFGRRYWAGLTLLVGLVWLVPVLKYLIMNFVKEKKEYERELIKNKYLPR